MVSDTLTYWMGKELQFVLILVLMEYGLGHRGARYKEKKRLS